MAPRSRRKDASASSAVDADDAKREEQQQPTEQEQEQQQAAASAKSPGKGTADSSQCPVHGTAKPDSATIASDPFSTKSAVRRAITRLVVILAIFVLMHLYQKYFGEDGGSALFSSFTGQSRESIRRAKIQEMMKQFPSE